MTQFGLFSPTALDSIANSNARQNIWTGAVRSGKTVSSIVRWMDYVAHAPPGDLVMIGKTERTLTANVLNEIERIVGTKRWRYNRGTGEAHLFGRRIHIRGANDVSSEGKIRGMTVAGAYGDELTLWPVEIYKQLLARMSVPGAMLFGTTNPDSPFHWLKKDFIDRQGELNLQVFPFTLDDNWTLDPDYVAALKAEYTGLWYRRFILGLWVQAEGAIYDMFDTDVHVVQERPEKFGTLHVGIDYGTANPSAFYQVGYDQERARWIVAREYYHDSKAAGRQKTDAQYSKDLRDFLDGLHPQTLEIDPSAASFITQLKQDGVQRIRKADHEVIDGIRTVSRALASGQLVIHESCEHLIEELANYSWDEKAQQRGEDKPVKANDHACDALRYVCMRIFGRRRAA